MRRPYDESSNNLFSTVCQVQTLFVLLSSLLIKMRSEIEKQGKLIEDLHGPEYKTAADEQWFNGSACPMHFAEGQASACTPAIAHICMTAPPHQPSRLFAQIAILVCTPIFLALALAFGETALPAWAHWRECRAINPAFPPSAIDFFFRAQTTCLPGHERLTKAMPDDVAEYLFNAEQDVEAEQQAGSVNKDLQQLIEATRHFAAVLYAPGDVKIDDGSGPVRVYTLLRTKWLSPQRRPRKAACQQSVQSVELCFLLRHRLLWTP